MDVERFLKDIDSVNVVISIKELKRTVNDLIVKNTELQRKIKNYEAPYFGSQIYKNETNENQIGDDKDDEPPNISDEKLSVQQYYSMFIT